MKKVIRNLNHARYKKLVEIGTSHSIFDYQKPINGFASIDLTHWVLNGIVIFNGVYE